MPFVKTVVDYLITLEDCITNKVFAVKGRNAFFGYRFIPERKPQ